MATSFTDWESDYLEHHGIPGMKWGVRRYQNKDGSLTVAGLRRYGTTDAHTGGSGGTKKTSARKMARDFNTLDRGYANIASDFRFASKRMNKYANKGMKYAAKKNLSSDQMQSNRKMQKIGNKMKKAAAEAKTAEQRMKGIENLQWRILATANKNGYSVNSKAVTRYGYDKKVRGVVKAMLYTGTGGAGLGAAVGAWAGSRATAVQGNKVKIKKTAQGNTPSTKVATYNHSIDESRSGNARTVLARAVSGAMIGSARENRRKRR